MRLLHGRHRRFRFRAHSPLPSLTGPPEDGERPALSCTRAASRSTHCWGPAESVPPRSSRGSASLYVRGSGGIMASAAPPLLPGALLPSPSAPRAQCVCFKGTLTVFSDSDSETPGTTPPKNSSPPEVPPATTPAREGDPGSMEAGIGHCRCHRSRRCASHGRETDPLMARLDLTEEQRNEERKRRFLILSVLAYVPHLCPRFSPIQEPISEDYDADNVQSPLGRRNYRVGGAGRRFGLRRPHLRG